MNDLAPGLAESLDRLPHRCGVYRFRDERGVTLYVGKAKNLFSRVRQYFLDGSSDSRMLVPFIRRECRAIDWVVTPSEKDALILENTLVKKEKPRYNVQLKDDKTYLSLRLDLRHEFPRICEAREFQQDGALYFGPYTSATAAREMLRLIERLFQLRRCGDHEFSAATRPCLYHDLGRCSAPCVALIGKDRYRQDVEHAQLMLSGKDRTLIVELRARMREASREQRYEDAARARDQAAAIEHATQSQRMVSRRFEDWDVFAALTQDDESEVLHLLVRQGKLVGAKSYTVTVPGEPDALLRDFLLRFYDDEPFIPPEVLLDREVPDAEVLAQWLSDKRGKKVVLSAPKRGRRRRMVDLARENAQAALRQRHEIDEGRRRTLEGLQRALSLPCLPRRIECFDISHLQGGDGAGSMAVFENGAPAKSQYRRYKVDHAGGDDYRALDEVLTRRMERALDEQRFPDLVIIDGGAAQLARALEVFERLGIAHHATMGVIGLAKARFFGSASRPCAPRLGTELRRDRNAAERRRDIEKTDERVFVPGKTLPLVLDPHGEELRLLCRLRDEAHRFALAYHRHRRAKRTFETGLEGIPGVGPRKRAALLAHFGTLDKLRGATTEELAAAPGISPTLAQRVHRYLNEGDKIPS